MSDKITVKVSDFEITPEELALIKDLRVKFHCHHCNKDIGWQEAASWGYELGELYIYCECGTDNGVDGQHIPQKRVCQSCGAMNVDMSMRDDDWYCEKCF